MTDTRDATDLEVRIRSYWNDAASAYDACPGHDLRTARERWAWQRQLERSFGPGDAGANKKILDVGTGTGSIAVLLANMGMDVAGVDIAPNMLEIARRRANKQGVSINLVEASADALPFEDDTYDIVFSRHLFWTLPKPIEAIVEWVRVAKPGGIVAIADGWWHEPTAEMRARRAVGRLVRRVMTPRHANPREYAHLSKSLPVAGGVSPYTIRYYLDQGGLEHLKVVDLRSIRAAERRSISPLLWIDRARYTWLAIGRKPE